MAAMKVQQIAIRNSSSVATVTGHVKEAPLDVNNSIIFRSKHMIGQTLDQANVML